MHFTKISTEALTVYLLLVFMKYVYGDKSDDIMSDHVEPIGSSIFGTARKSDTVNDTSKEYQFLIKSVINKKIEELKPYLQDEDFITIDTENKLTLEGKDETTIIEFIPKYKDHNKTENNELRTKDEPLKDNVSKYKKIRNKIKKALSKETVSDKTQLLVVNTLDDLIAKLISSQCSRQSVPETDTKSNNLRTNNVIKQLWYKQWETLKNGYVKRFKSEAEFNEILSFLDKLQKLFSLITNDVDRLVDRYRVKCEFMDRTEVPATFRKNHNFVYSPESDINIRHCKQFLICSGELKNFMLEFYNYLNDTTITVIRNYAEMYLRDTDSNAENNNIVVIINGTCNTIVEKIVEIFNKQTRNFRLVENKNKESNLNALSKYVKSIIMEVRSSVRNVLKDKLNTISERVRYAIQKDLTVNLKVDTENLEQEFLSRICLVFKYCNGRYEGRRSGYHVNVDKEKDIFVRVQLTLDNMKNNTSNGRSNKILSNSIHNVLVKQTTSYNVTRTTPYS